MKQLIAGLLSNESGQDLIEYGLLATFIALVVAGAIQAIGPTLNGTFVKIGNAIP